jgi:predicted O-linked N-acetylglucosamine transferase (SPINDLY family)
MAQPLLNVDLIFEEGLKNHLLGKLDQAELAYQSVLSVAPKHYDALHHYGLIYLQRGDLHKAIHYIRDSIKASPKQPFVLSNLAHCLNAVGQFQSALDISQESIDQDPEIEAAWTNMGTSQRNLGLFQDAQLSYERALEISPKNPICLYNLGLVFFDQKDYGKARKFFSLCLEMDPDMYEAHSNLSHCLFESNDQSGGLKHAEIAAHLRPNNPESFIILGNAYTRMRRYNESLRYYELALQASPNRAEYWYNHGNILQTLGEYTKSVSSYERAISLNPKLIDAWFNLGKSFSELGKFHKSISCFEKVIENDGDFGTAIGNLARIRVTICDWMNLEKLIVEIRTGISLGLPTCSPLTLAGLSDDPLLQMRCAEIYSRVNFYQPAKSDRSKIRTRGDKIRLGYFSMDFREHAVSYLIAEVIERHDREGFEIYGFSFGHKTNDSMSERLERAFDRFIDVRHLSDGDIAELSTSTGIDIAIDLGGYTRDSRPGIFLNRAAPIQINYLGYPGTMGSESMDYIIADRVLIPDQQMQCYSEKVIYLPNCYQPSDSSRLAPASRSERYLNGLPDDGFVYCCFNSTWKILPSMFDVWCDLLLESESSVLWLLEDNVIAANNLKKESEKRGVDPSRLIFAPRLNNLEHLARYSLVDLFLDTFPYGAHTTANDALWCGVPVVTLSGRSFPSRVASSLLTALDLPELIAATPEEYRSIAHKLEKDPERLVALRKKLTFNVQQSPLFKTQVITRNLETAFETAYSRFTLGLELDHIYL